MGDRWIKYHPDRFEQWVYKDSVLDVRFLLLVAGEVQSLPGVNHGIVLQPGEAMLSLTYIAQALGCTKKQVRTLIKRGTETGQIVAQRRAQLGMIYSLAPQAVFEITLAAKGTAKGTGEGTNKRKNRYSGGKHQPLPLAGATTSKEKENALSSEENNNKEERSRFDLWD